LPTSSKIPASLGINSTSESSEALQRRHRGAKMIDHSTTLRSD
jgi:hypothetical protein